MVNGGRSAHLTLLKSLNAKSTSCNSNTMVLQKLCYQALSKRPTKIYLNLCGEHLSLITDRLHYIKEFVCKQCGKVLSEMRNLQNHERRCDGTVKCKYPGGVYTNTPSIFEELESNGIIVADELKFKKYFTVFDFEAYQRDFNQV